jgi:signal transduction histidine kinase
VLRLGTEHGQAVIQVCDRGPGVPQAQQDRIFEPFYRLPGASERDGGVGLGLALVKSIALRHGGSVSCNNQDGGGACFEVRLPTSV